MRGGSSLIPLQKSGELVTFLWKKADKFIERFSFRTMSSGSQYIGQQLIIEMSDTLFHQGSTEVFTHDRAGGCLQWDDC